MSEKSDAYKWLLNSWLEYLNLFSSITPIIPSLGMVQTYRKRMVEIGRELALISKSISEFNDTLPKYNQQIFTIWSKAMSKAVEKCNRENITDKDEIKKVWINTLEEEFTNLFNSDEFGSISSKLLNSENDMNRHMAKIAEIYSRALNMPTRSEVDDIYGEVTKLKREVKKISDQLKELEETSTKS